MKLTTQLIAATLLLASLLIAPAVASPPQGTSEWIVLAPADEGFTVQVPVKPDEQLQRIPMMGNTYKMHLFTSVHEASGVLYMAIMQEFPALSAVLTPAARLDKFMEGFKQGLIKSLSNTPGTQPDIQPDRDLELKGHIGRQYTLSFGESRGLVRTFDAGRRVYVLLVLGADEKNSSVGKFLSSFEITTAPDPVAIPIPETKPS